MQAFTIEQGTEGVTTSRLQRFHVCYPGRITTSTNRQKHLRAQFLRAKYKELGIICLEKYTDCIVFKRPSQPTTNGKDDLSYE